MPKRALTALALSALMLTGSLAVATAAPAATAPRVTKTYRIMPLGDSITRGGGQVKGQYRGYRLALQKQLAAGAPGFRYDFVGSMLDKGVPDGNHEGHGGWTIDDMAARIDAWMVTFKPDIVLLHAGTNNITEGDSPALTASKLKALIARIRAHNAGTKIFVAKVIASRYASRQTITAVYQSLIPRVVASAGADVHLVDQSTVGGTDIYDWTHPNDFGYLKMAYNWYRSLNLVIGGGKWRSMASPYRVRTATICQINYTTSARACRTRAVN